MFRFAAAVAWPRTAPVQAFAALRNMLIAGFFLSQGFLIGVLYSVSIHA